MAKISVGVLGATGMVGQNYIALLGSHPWFQVRYAAASRRSAGMKYAEAVAGRWQLAEACDPGAGKLAVEDAGDVERAAAARAKGKCAFVFSALEMGKDETRALEEAYAAAGIPVISNSSAHRWTPDVPVLIPEINPHHADVIPAQREARGWERGFIAAKPNCSIQSYMIPLHALVQAGYLAKRLVVTTMQAVSGAGYPGVSSLDMIDNVVPYIAGEEEKSEMEPLKIFGVAMSGKIKNAIMPKISACCNRVPVIDGHMACVNLQFGAKKPSIGEIKKIWAEFRGLPQEQKFPSAPQQPIIYLEEEDRPQPRRDRCLGRAMSVAIGRLRP